MSRWLGIGLVMAGAFPKCACDEEGGLRIAEIEMRMTFLEQDSCSDAVIRRRIPDDYQGGLSPTTDFGSRGERVFEIRAEGEIPLTVSDVHLSEEDSEFSIALTDGDGMPVTLPVDIALFSEDVNPGPGLVVTVTYAAADAEPDLVELVVESSDPDRSEVRFGLAAGRGKLEVCVDGVCGDQAAVDFGPVSRDTSATKEVTLTNTGEGSLDIRSIRLDAVSGEFCAPEATELPDGLMDCTLIPQCMVLLPGESYTVNVTYSPLDGQTDTGSLTIVSGDASAGNVVVPINGSGAGPALCACAVEGDQCNPTALIDFGTVDVGASSDRTVRLESCGTEPVDLTEATLETMPGSPFTTGPEFSVSTVFPVSQLAPGETSEGVIRYSPMGSGTHRGGLRYAYGQSQLQSWIALVGQAATCDLVVIPQRVDFGTVAGGASADRTVVITNAGAKDCTVSQITDPATPFAVVNAPTLPLTVASGTSTDLTVRFSPPAGMVQPYTATFDIASDEPGAGATETVDLLATGGGAATCQVEVAPTSQTITMRDGLLNFGAVNVGYTTTLPIRIRNTGNANCTLASYTLNSLRGRSEFSVTTAQPAPIMIQPGQIQEISVAFSPTSSSDLPYTSLVNSVDFVLNGPSLMQTDWSIGILARATTPAIDVLPRDVDFGTVTWENPLAPDNRSTCGSETRDITIYNSGSGPLTISSIEIAASSDPVFLVTEVSQGGSTLTAPYTNINVNGGQSLSVRLRFFPSRASPASHRGLLVIDNDVTNPMGNGAPLTVPLTGEGTTNAGQTDTFQQLTDNKVDILWVVDDSGSMQDEQNALSNNFQSFISFADSLSVDYQVGVITTEVNDSSVSGVLWACNGYNPIIDASDANRVAAFQCAARVTNPPNGNRRPNPGGSDSQEAGLQAARIALDVPNVTGANNGFLRSDARLAVIIVSDEDDQSDGSVNLYVDFFRNLKGFRNSQLVSVSAIAGDVPNGCSTAVAGDRYAAAASALNGRFESICASSWTNMLRGIGLGVFALRSSWTLSRPADPSTIRVTVNGQTVSQSSTNGWTYDSTFNTIDFFGSAVPNAGATVTVTYDSLCLR